MHTYTHAITITHSIRILGLQPCRLSRGSLGAVKLSECGDLSSLQRPATSISHKIYREANTGCDEDTAARQRELECVCWKSLPAMLMLSFSVKFFVLLIQHDKQRGGGEMESHTTRYREVYAVHPLLCFSSVSVHASVCICVCAPSLLQAVISHFQYPVLFHSVHCIPFNLLPLTHKHTQRPTVFL